MYDNRIKRIADFLEKLTVAGAAVALFQEKYFYILWAVPFLAASLYLTKEK